MRHGHSMRARSGQKVTFVMKNVTERLVTSDRTKVTKGATNNHPFRTNVVGNKADTPLTLFA